MCIYRFSTLPRLAKCPAGGKNTHEKENYSCPLSQQLAEKKPSQQQAEERRKTNCTRQLGVGV